MKPSTGFLLSSALVVALSCAIGCNSETPSKVAANAPSANLESVTFFVEGMV